MSSDSDSDVCDFTSDISKQMSKGRDQFWQRFNKVAENYKSNHEDVIDQNIDMTYMPSIPDVKPTFNDYVNINQISTKESTSDTYTENAEINVQNRIVNKLNKLSAEVDTILDKKCKSQRNKRKPVKRPQRKRKRYAYDSNLGWDESSEFVSDFVSDSEIDNIVSTIFNSEEQNQEEELNPIMTVNILWQSVINNSFKVHKYQLLNCILEHYSKEYKVRPELLFFTLDDRQIQLEENSFVSLRLNKENQIEGGILPESCLSLQQVKNINTENEMEFKARHSERKCEITVHCKKDDKMEIIFWQVCKHFEQPVENIKIYFKNCVVKPSTNISELNLDKNACVDVYVLNNLK